MPDASLGLLHTMDHIFGAADSDASDSGISGHSRGEEKEKVGDIKFDKLN